MELPGKQDIREMRSRIAELEVRIADLQAQWPAHSVPAAMVEQLDELEEALEEAKRALAEADAKEGIEADGP